MTELQTELPGSAETWRNTAPPPRVPDALLPPQSGSPRVRLRAWRQRHLLRERRAQRVLRGVAAARSAGLPVADRHAVWRFFGDLVRTRRAPSSRCIGLHALAAVAGLVVPRILGFLVDEASGAGTPVGDAERAGAGRGRGGGDAGPADLPRAADVGALRPGSAGRGPGVHRADRARACRSAGWRAPAPVTWSPGSPGTSAR